MISLLMIVVALSVLWLVGCAVWSIRVPERRTWPPSERSGLVYRLNAILGPGLNFGLVGLSVLGWNTFVFDHWVRFVVGVPAFALGAYLSLGGVFRLGARRTQGYRGDLEASGPYRLTRNPQYVGAMLSFVGLAVICNSAAGLAGALLASVWFALLPFVEEPWLREKLGRPYEEYASRVPRYLSLRSLVGGSD